MDYIDENPPNVIFLIVYQYQSKIIRVMGTKEKMYQLLVYSCNIFPVIDLNEHTNTILYLLRNFSDVYA